LQLDEVGVEALAVDPELRESTDLFCIDVDVMRKEHWMFEQLVEGDGSALGVQ
jgi:hypothetical protein